MTPRFTHKNLNSPWNSSKKTIHLNQLKMVKFSWTLVKPGETDEKHHLLNRKIRMERFPAGTSFRMAGEAAGANSLPPVPATHGRPPLCCLRPAVTTGAPKNDRFTGWNHEKSPLNVVFFFFFGGGGHAQLITVSPTIAQLQVCEHSGCDQNMSKKTFLASKGEP